MFCHKCAARLTPGAQFCSKCRTAVPPPPRGGHHHHTPPPLSRHMPPPPPRVVIAPPIAPRVVIAPPPPPRPRYEWYASVSPAMLLLPWTAELPGIMGTTVSGRSEADVLQKLTLKLNDLIVREMRFNRMPIQPSLRELTAQLRPGRRLVQIFPTVRF